MTAQEKVAAAAAAASVQKTAATAAAPAAGNTNPAVVKSAFAAPPKAAGAASPKHFTARRSLSPGSPGAATFAAVVAGTPNCSPTLSPAHSAGHSEDQDVTMVNVEGEDAYDPLCEYKRYHADDHPYLGPEIKAYDAFRRSGASRAAIATRAASLEAAYDQVNLEEGRHAFEVSSQPFPEELLRPGLAASRHAPRAADEAAIQREVDEIVAKELAEIRRKEAEVLRRAESAERTAEAAERANADRAAETAAQQARAARLKAVLSDRRAQSAERTAMLERLRAAEARHKAAVAKYDAACKAAAEDSSASESGRIHPDRLRAHREHRRALPAANAASAATRTRASPQVQAPVVLGGKFSLSAFKSGDLKKWLQSFFLEAAQRSFRGPALQTQLSQLLPESLRDAAYVDLRTCEPLDPEACGFEQAVTDSILVSHGGTPTGELPEVYMQRLQARVWKKQTETIDQYLLAMARAFTLYCEASAMDAEGRRSYERLFLVPQILRTVPAAVRTVFQPHKQYSFAEARPLLLQRVYELALMKDACVRGAKVTGLVTNDDPPPPSSSHSSANADTAKRKIDAPCEHERGPRGCTRKRCPFEHIIEETRGTGLQFRRKLERYLGTKLPREDSPPPAAKRGKKDHKGAKRDWRRHSPPDKSSPRSSPDAKSRRDYRTPRQDRTDRRGRTDSRPSRQDRDQRSRSESRQSADRSDRRSTEPRSP